MRRSRKFNVGARLPNGFARPKQGHCVMSKLNGKIAVVTGGSSGIGLSAAKRVVNEGAVVFVVGRRQSEREKEKAAIGKNVNAVQADVADLDDLDRLYGRVRD